VRDQPNCDQSPEWEPLKGRPYDDGGELQLMSVSGNTTEFQNRLDIDTDVSKELAPRNGFRCARIGG
jgi:hypothetical protein